MKSHASLLAVTLVASASTALAANITWDNGNADGLWNTGLNWSTDTVPVAADTAFFTDSSLTSVRLDGATSSSSNISFGNGTGFTIGNATGDTANLSMSGKTITVTDAGSYTINLTNGSGTGDTGTGRLDLNNTTFSIAANGKLTLDGRYSGTSGALRTITKSGAGTLELAGNVSGMSLTVAAAVNGGTLLLNSSGTAQRLTGINSIASGATVRFMSANKNLGSGSTGFFANLGVNSISGTLDMNGFSHNIPRISGSATGIITNSGTADAVITLGDYGNRASMSDRSSTFAGSIQDGATNKLSVTINSLTGTSPLYNLTLSGANSYTGNTTITAGGLILSSTGSLLFDIGANGVNNSILGAGTVTLDGIFNFDLSGAGLNLGDTWNIVDVTNLNETFGSTFTVSDFTDNGDGTWSKDNGGIIYGFNESTGLLSVVSVPEPSVALLGSLGALALLRRRRN